MERWFGGHVWAAWLIASLTLSALEMLTGDFTLLMLGGGALAGGITAVFFPTLWWLQLLVAGVVATAMLGLLRPELLRKFRADAPGYASQLERIVGSEGVAREAITAQGGSVLVGGDTWTARPDGPGWSIEAGERIRVVQLDGVVAIVQPVEDPR